MRGYVCQVWASVGNCARCMPEQGNFFLKIFFLPTFLVKFFFRKNRSKKGGSGRTFRVFFSLVTSPTHLLGASTRPTAPNRAGTHFRSRMMGSIDMLRFGGSGRLPVHENPRRKFGWKPASMCVAGRILARCGDGSVCAGPHAAVPQDDPGAETFAPQPRNRAARRYPPGPPPARGRGGHQPTLRTPGGWGTRSGDPPGRLTATPRRARPAGTRRVLRPAGRRAPGCAPGGGGAPGGARPRASRPPVNSRTRPWPGTPVLGRAVDVPLGWRPPGANAERGVDLPLPRPGRGHGSVLTADVSVEHIGSPVPEPFVRV